MSDATPVLELDMHDVCILLDVDGTILDIAPTPREVSVAPSLRRTLERLWNRTAGALAFVSGRPLGELDLIFSPLQLPAIGGHGAELRTTAGTRPGQPRIPALDFDLKRKFAEIAKAGPGIIVEDKGYSLALHYRLAPDKENFVRGAAAAICAQVRESPIELLPGKSMLEIKQAGFNKASAVRDLMMYPPFAGRRPIFIGDDVTDEDVFTIMPEFDGIGISVGRKLSGVTHCFERPVHVRRWLDQISRTDAFALP